MNIEQFAKQYKFVKLLKQPSDSQFHNRYYIMDRKTPDLEVDKALGEVQFVRNGKMQWEGSVLNQTLSTRQDMGAILVSRGTEEEAKLQLQVEMAKKC